MFTCRSIETAKLIITDEYEGGAFYGHSVFGPARTVYVGSREELAGAGVATAYDVDGVEQPA